VRNEPANILLVDDRPENLMALEAILEPLGHRLISVTSGPKALRELLHTEFALILLDVNMPGLDGFATADYIKQRPRTAHVPIIFLTAYSAESTQMSRAYAAGAVDYLFKPFDPIVLRAKVAVFLDLYHLRRRAEQLAHRALHDPLTGLPNRTLVLDRLEQALAGLARSPGSVGVLFIDLDRFKEVNDTLGHDAGDQLLVETAERIRDVLRPTDTLARFGGDEFVILCEGLGGPEQGAVIANRIREAVAAPFVLGGQRTTVSASIGIALADGPEQNPAALLRAADIDMYRAKGASLERATEPRARRGARAAMSEVRALRTAVADGQLKVHYQPIVEVDTGAIAGIEALVRWDHPVRGLLDPVDFLQLAKDHGMVIDLGEVVLREACGQVAQWRDARGDQAPLTLSVNLAAAQLADPAFPDAVAAALADFEIPATQLCLELTESAVNTDPESLNLALRALSDLGVRLAVDDFGTGQSSLSHLKRFPIDILKIHGSFVEGLGANPHDDAIVGAVLGLASSLGMEAIAEGVELPLQREILLGLGCRLAQGNLFWAPQTAEELTPLLVQAGPPVALTAVGLEGELVQRVG
jgi:diguanylate cyclase (GGDEF)-like protein